MSDEEGVENVTSDEEIGESLGAYMNQVDLEESRVSPTAFLPDGKIGIDSDKTEEINLTFDNEHKVKEETLEKDPLQRLLSAAENGNVNLVEELLVEEANLHEGFDEDGYRALHRASYEGHVGVAKVLISRGADVRAKTLDGWEPLHSACRWGKVEVASLLLQNGADINAQTNGKQTPLHLAALGASGSSTLKLLLSNRWLDPSLVNSQGETAYDIAYRTGKWYRLFEVTEDSLNV